MQRYACLITGKDSKGKRYKTVWSITAHDTKDARKRFHDDVLLEDEHLVYTVLRENAHIDIHGGGDTNHVRSY